MAVWALPKVMAIMSNDFKGKGYIYYKDNGAVALGEASVFSTKARIEVEQAKTNSKYVNLRFSYTNRYMHRTADGSWAMAAVSTQPQEDTSDPFCTLFEPIKVEAQDDDLFYLIHAQSGGRLVIDSASMLFYVEFDLISSTQGYLRGEDLDALVRLPGSVAFIGDNAKYLKAFNSGGENYLQFSSDVPNDSLSRHQVSQTPDGHVRLTSSHWSTLWRLATDDWIFADATTLTDFNTLFWPVKIDDSTVALRSAANGKFCQRRVVSGIINGSLGAVASAPTREAGLQVEELVTLSEVSNVRYQMEYARVFDEAPYSAWSSTVFNDGAEDAYVAVSFTYQDSRDYTFGRSFSLAMGVPTTIEAALPFIDKDASVDAVSYQINAPLQWNAANTITTAVTARGSVRVPARSSAVVSYVGTRATFNVPYYYTQLDNSNPSAVKVVTEAIDGLYTAVNCYDFKLVVEKTQPLGE